MTQSRIVLPAKARRGEVIEIRALAQHVMETGHRRTDMGVPIPRDIIERFVVTYDGEEVFSAELGPGIAANPYFAFTTTATRSGELVFTWTDGKGTSTVERRRIEVE
jgi:sulfur-oxidizing protein SoxZ